MTGKKIPECPSCGKPVVAAENPYSPFCSERCKMVDLEAWLGEKYYVQGEPDEDGRVWEEEDGDKE